MVKGSTQTKGQWKANLHYLQGQAQLHLAVLRAKNIAAGELPCSANPITQIRFYTDPLLS